MSVVMAGALCAATSSVVITHLRRRHHFSTASGILRKSVIIVSSLAAPFPTKPTRRRNYLRQKILKTLKKPFIFELPSTEPVISIDFPIRQEEVKAHEETEIQELDKFENQESVGLEETEIQELDKFENQGFREAEVSSSSGVIVNGGISRFHKNSVLNYGLWLVGAFVFHTVCAVWIFRSATLDSKDRTFSESDKDEYSGLDENEKNKSKVELFLNGNGIVGFENGGVNSVVNVDEVEMQRKIEEIRTMAREARAREKLESKNNGLDSEENNDIDDGKFSKSGIEKEVDNRLIKLQKKLEKSHKKLPVSSVGILRTADERKNGLEKDKLGEKEGNGALMFKKKYKFKDLLNNLDEKPKGFINSEHDSFNKFKQGGNMEKGNELLRSGNDDNYIEDSDGSDLIRLEENGEKKGTVDVTVSSNSMPKKSVKEKGTRKQGKKGVAKLKVKNGNVSHIHYLANYLLLQSWDDLTVQCMHILMHFLLNSDSYTSTLF